MAGETNISELIKGLKPTLCPGEYVFVTTKDMTKINRSDTICEFTETEGVTVVMERKKADTLNLRYEYVASWITLMIHSSMEAVGLTAAFSTELTKHGISCNVISGYYHDHIFVDKRDAQKAIYALEQLSKNYK